MPLLLFLISAILAARDYLDFLISNKFRTLAHRVTISTFMANGNHCKLQSEMPSSAAVSVMWWMRLNPHKYFNFLDSGDQSPASSLQTLNGTFTNTNTFHTARGSTEYKYFTVFKIGMQLLQTISWLIDINRYQFDDIHCKFICSHNGRFKSSMAILILARLKCTKCTSDLFIHHRAEHL